MWFTAHHNRDALERATSDLIQRIQRLEREHVQLRAQLEGERHLRMFAIQLSNAAAGAPALGAAFERVAESMRAPAPRGRAGGLARASKAWRRFDGTFMPESVKIDAYHQEYERYAVGGRARALNALRSANGTFLRNSRNMRVGEQ